jgi:Dyp-type peroxidase family
MADEPVLDMTAIQGNIVGFNKPFQTLLYFHIDDAALFKTAVADLGDLVSTADQVLSFNRRRSAAIKREEEFAETATWVNVAFSAVGLRKLTEDGDLFADPSFGKGMIRSTKLGDPEDGPGHPDTWTIRDGADDNATDMLVIVAADVPDDLKDKAKQVMDLIAKAGGATHSEPDHGQGLGGFEHFGFRDNISRPRIRGRASDGPTDFVTPRPNPADPNQAGPGQELIWPGEFVFGYADQRGSLVPGVADWMKDGAGYPRAPEWARNGSYLVFRRLRQNVHRFHRFLADHRGELSAAALAARICGRWPSGAPIERAPDADDPALAEDNDFDFPAVASCPGDAHIRKVNPRSDVPEADRLRHRLLRRGIPFGDASTSTIDDPGDDDGIERGLLFLAYMTSIVNQFEFVTSAWANNAAFHAADVGADALLRQPGESWIVPTGGGYYFSPAVSALKGVLSA